MTPYEPLEVPPGRHHRRLDPGDIGDEGLGVQGAELLFDGYRGAGEHHEIGTGDRVFDRWGQAVDRSASDRPVAGTLVRVPADHHPPQSPQSDPDRGPDEPGSQHGGDRAWFRARGRGPKRWR